MSAGPRANTWPEALAHQLRVLAEACPPACYVADRAVLPEAAAAKLEQLRGLAQSARNVLEAYDAAVQRAQPKRRRS